MSGEEISKLNNALLTIDEEEILINLDMSEVTDLSIISASQNGNTIKLNGTFYNCKALYSITLPDSVIYLNLYAFKGCSSLTNLSAKNVTYIGQSAFEDCISLTNFELPSKTSQIRNQAFKGCLNLESISIGKKMKSNDQFGYEIFDNCPKFKTINYALTIQDWKNINIENKSSIPKGTIIKCTDGEYKM
ncbi:leucine-rich repeat domain-containing protein [uncultured Treponema sp.]|uniref:leucine-rich repeat domain-containing protein n=1 Tax=uncultured Treponema sp. TaxID=162155 RepID=UPI0025E00B0E|nr:leucine-rich repeat domain-containing protein [uncultured Treponema sp.]